MQSTFLSKIRQQNPLIHNITNIVVANYSANGLLALGASPIMADSVEEMADMQQISHALVINIGTLSAHSIKAMLAAGKEANKLGRPVILDPVGVGASAYRKQVVKQLLNEIQFSLIRGNAGELACIAGVDWQAKGVDAGCGNIDLSPVAQQLAQQYRTIIGISGSSDIISNGKQTALVHNGTAMFPKITGSGCLLSAVCGAFLAVAPDTDYFVATIEAFTCYAIAGELTACSLKPTEYGKFNLGLLDQLGNISPQQITQYGRVEYV